MLVRVDASGVEVFCDRGEEPFPGEQLFAPEAYLAGLETFPRNRLPVWLAAYVGRGGSQSRPPRQAAEGMRRDRSEGVRAVPVNGELPDLAVLWARWAVLSAAFVAAGSEWGPRVCPSVGVFESAGHSGSTLTLLPGGRAVLSGGVWNAPVLDAVYNAGAVLPRFFAGEAPREDGKVLGPLEIPPQRTEATTRASSQAGAAQTTFSTPWTAPVTDTETQRPASSIKVVTAAYRTPWTAPPNTSPELEALAAAATATGASRDDQKSADADAGAGRDLS